MVAEKTTTALQINNNSIPTIFKSEFIKDKEVKVLNWKK